MLCLFSATILAEKLTESVEVSVCVVKVDDTTPPERIDTLRAFLIGNNRIRLLWKPAKDNSGIDHYCIYRSTFRITESNKNNADIVADYVKPVTWDTNFKEDEPRNFYVVTAFDNAGNESKVSNYASIYLASNIVSTNQKYSFVSASENVEIEIPAYTFSKEVFVEINEDAAKLNVQSNLNGILVPSNIKDAIFQIKFLDYTTLKVLDGKFRNRILLKVYYPPDTNSYIAHNLKIYKWMSDGWALPAGEQSVDIDSCYVWMKVQSFSIFRLGFSRHSVTNYSDIHIYPNPYKPQEANEGVIKFEGLTETTKLTIYTISGKKVWQSLEAGADGLLTWDGKNKNARQVETGIYLYLLKDWNDNKKIGRIALVR